MKRMILAVVVATGLANPPAVRAQIVVGPGYGGRAVYGGGLGFSYHRHNFRAFGFAGAYSARSFLGYPPAPVLPPFSVLTPYGFSPGFIGPGWGAPPAYGWNPVWGPSFFGPAWDLYGPPQPPVFVLPPPIILAGNNEVQAGDAGGGRAVVIRPDDEPRPMPINAANFLVIEPKKNPVLPPPGQIVPAVDRVVKIDRLPLLPPPRFDPFAPPRGLPRDLPDPDPLKEATRLMKFGREAFAAGEYGRASERFGRAAAANPKLAEPHFLKAQASLAAGSYAEAFAAVRVGLVLDPAWPASPFDLKEPYGVNAALFAEHLAELRKAAAANPREPTLQFLLGYQLWFVGEKVEAKKWLDAAEKHLAGPEVIALFK